MATMFGEPMIVPSPSRYGEIDFLRVVALFLMLAYHAAYDATFFYGIDVGFSGVAWTIVGRTSALLFLSLAGVSSAISWHRRRSMWYVIQRSLLIVTAGGIVSLVTWLLDPLTFVRFGILHLIGVSLLLFAILPQRSLWSFMIFIVGLLFWFWHPSIQGSWLLLPFGFPPSNFQSVDYYPLLPWFLVLLVGRVIGEQCYVRHSAWRSLLPSVPPSMCYGAQILTFLSRRSLLLYMLHQPVLLLLFTFPEHLLFW